MTRERSRSSAKRSKYHEALASDGSDSEDYRRSKHGRDRSRMRDRNDRDRQDRHREERRHSEHSRRKSDKRRRDDPSDDSSDASSLKTTTNTVAVLKFRKKARRYTKPLRGSEGQKYAHRLALRYPVFGLLHEWAYRALGPELDIKKPVSLYPEKQRKQLERKYRPGRHEDRGGDEDREHRKHGRHSRHGRDRRDRKDCRK